MKRKPAKLVLVDPPLPIHIGEPDAVNWLFTSLTSLPPLLICNVKVRCPLGIGDNVGTSVAGGRGVGGTGVGGTGVFPGLGVGGIGVGGIGVGVS